MRGRPKVAGCIGNGVAANSEMAAKVGKKRASGGEEAVSNLKEQTLDSEDENAASGGEGNSETMGQEDTAPQGKRETGNHQKELEAEDSQYSKGDSAKIRLHDEFADGLCSHC